MAKKRWHSTLLALLVFIYPIAFMTFHVLHDHLPVDVCPHSCCGDENQQYTGEKNETENIDENTHCLICEYEFSKTETTLIILIFQESYSTPTYCEILFCRVHISFTGTIRSLRAPPVIA